MTQILCKMKGLYVQTTILSETFKIGDKWIKFVLCFNCLCATEDVGLGFECFKNYRIKLNYQGKVNQQILIYCADII